MKRTFWRKKRLDAFMLDINDFERLWAKLLAQFDNPKGVSVSFEVELREEKFTFQNIKEIKRCSELSDSITEYSLRLIQDDRFLRLDSEDNSSFGHKRATIWATGDNVGWCAGVIETSVSFLRKYRVWYRWIYSDLAKVVMSFIVAVIVTAFCHKSLEKVEISPPNIAVIGVCLIAIYTLVYILAPELSHKADTPSQCYKNLGEREIYSSAGDRNCTNSYCNQCRYCGYYLVDTIINPSS